MADHKETTFIDIYEAAGAKVNEDRTQAELDAHMKPFDIVLRVIPTGYEMGLGPSKMTFGVILNSEFVVFDENPQMLHQYDFDEFISLPIKQVRILKKE